MSQKPSILKRLRGDRRGVSAVEIAPIAIAFYMGSAEFCQGFMAQKRMGHVASQVADMLAQQEQVNRAGIDGLFDIGGLIMSPFSATPLKLRISSVVVGNDGVAKVAWSRGDGMTARSVGEVITPPEGLVIAGQSVIMSEATYDYDSPVDYLMPSVTRFNQTYWLRPRMVEAIPCSNC